MKKAQWCDQSLVSTPFKFCLCVSAEQYAKELKKLGIAGDHPFVLPGSGASLHRFDSLNGGDPLAFICIDVGDMEHNQVHALLVHEAVHLWRYTREELGEDAPSKEFEAYAVQAISQRLFYAYDKLSGKKK
jgi:hypothetical protein